MLLSQNFGRVFFCKFTPRSYWSRIVCFEEDEVNMFLDYSLAGNYFRFDLSKTIFDLDYSLWYKLYGAEVIIINCLNKNCVGSFECRGNNGYSITTFYLPLRR